MVSTDKQRYIARLIVKYLRQDLTEEEQMELERWRKRSRHNERLFCKYTSNMFYHSMQSLYVPGEEQEMWKSLQQRMRNAGGYRRRRLYYRLGAVACMLLVGVVSGILWLQPETARPAYSLTDIQPRSAQATLVVDDVPVRELSGPVLQYMAKDAGTSDIHVHMPEWMIENVLPSLDDQETNVYQVRVPRGGEYRLGLNDSSYIHLNSESALKFSSDFTADSRSVDFIGEAYFDITHQPDEAPFLIHTPVGTVQVLGTAFNLRYYEEEKALQLTLESGRVAFTTLAGRQAQVMPGEQLCYYADTDSLSVTGVSTPYYTSWRHGLYMFKQVRLDKIMRDLSRCYNVPITFASDDLRDITFTGEVRCYDRFELVIELFEMTKMVRFVLTADGVCIHKG